MKIAMQECKTLLQAGGHGTEDDIGTAERILRFSKSIMKSGKGVRSCQIVEDNRSQ